MQLEPEHVDGPALRCRVDAGAFDCDLEVADGFRVGVVTMLVEATDRSEEIVFAGDFEVAELAAGQAVTQFDVYPVNLDIQVHYRAEAIQAPDGSTSAEAVVRCQVQLVDEVTAGAVTCEAGSYERWEVILRPDEEMQAEWEDRTFGAASLHATIAAEAQTEGLCFQEYPRCDATGLTERWSEVSDADGIVPDELHYTFTLPTEQVETRVAVASNLAFDSATIAGPGVYVLHADGTMESP